MLFLILWHYEGDPRNQTKAWARDLDETGSRQENASEELEEGTKRRQLVTDDGRRRGEVGSRHGTSERLVAWDKVQQQLEETSQDELAFLVALWKFREGCTSALVYRCTKECRVSQLNLLALELTQAHIVRLFFVLFSHSLDCISCSHEEMCDTPIGTTGWFTGQDWNGLKKLMYLGCRAGIVTIWNYFLLFKLWMFEVRSLGGV